MEMKCEICGIMLQWLQSDVDYDPVTGEAHVVCPNCKQEEGD